MIELHRIGKTYRRGNGDAVRALDDVSLGIERGEFVAVVGSSGSGKSTLMNIIGLLDQPSDGRYLFDGHEAGSLDVTEQARLRNRKIGFVFQAFHLLPRTSALENVELPLIYSDRRSIDGLGRASLEAVGLGDRLHHTPSELSGGQQQRVAIARALVNDPDLLLADEPTGNLDADSAAEIMAIFQGLNHAGRTIVLVTHDASLAAGCSRIVRLDRGRVIADGSTLKAGHRPADRGLEAAGRGAGSTSFQEAT